MDMSGMQMQTDPVNGMSDIETSTMQQLQQAAQAPPRSGPYGQNVYMGVSDSNPSSLALLD